MLSGAHCAHASLFSPRSQPKSRWTEKRRPVCKCKSGTRLTRCLNPGCSVTATEVCHCQVKTVRHHGVLKTNCTCPCTDCEGAGCGSRKKIAPIAAAAAPPPTPPQLPTTGPGPQPGCTCVQKGSATCGGDCWWKETLSIEDIWAMPPLFQKL